MRCSGCEIQIPPKWIHCINSNTCPHCGEAIYSDEQKELLEEVREALQQMEDVSAEGMVGWLLSNYVLKKIGEVDDPEFYEKPAKQEEPTTPSHMKGFYERANIARELEKRKDLGAIAQILKSGEADAQYGTSIDADGDINVAEEADIMPQGQDHEAPQFLAKELLANNAPMPTDTTPLSSEETAAVMQAVKGEVTEECELDNVPSLNRQRMDRLRKQAELGNTGSVGSIKRR